MMRDLMHMVLVLGPDEAGPRSPDTQTDVRAFKMGLLSEGAL